MRLGRLHVGKWSWANPKDETWRDWFTWIYVGWTSCQCWIVHVGKIEIAWYSPDCQARWKERELGPMKRDQAVPK